MTAVESIDVAPVPCPRCGKDDARPQLKLVHSWIVRCGGCGMSYVNPRATSAHIESKLQQWARQDVVDEARLSTAFDEGNLSHYGRLLDALDAHVGYARGKLLDVGCSTGAFLSVARSRGWEVAGLEIGIASCAHARERLGIDAHRASIYDFDAPAGSFRAVALLEVIEHLERPLEALGRIHGLLEPGGLLLLTTPNYDSLYRRIFGARWWVVNCEDEHIVLFNRATLAGALRETGFEILDERIRGLDLAGLAREAKRSLAGSKAGATQAEAAQGYYEARDTRARLKALLEKIGLLAAVRAMLRGVDRTFTWRLSPTHAWGEQLIVVARREP